MAENTKNKQQKSKAAKGKAEAAKKTSGKKDKGKVEIPPLPDDYVPRMLKLYIDKVIPALKKKFNYTNVNIIPRLDKIVLNVGDGTLHQDAKLAESIARELTLISGQKAVFTKAKKSISNFKLREGMVVGCRVTLRQTIMYEFFDRLITFVIPRIRDFRGMNERSFDGRGNYTFGVLEQIIFPEIDYDKVVKIHGMDITITTTSKNDEEALELLKGFGFPFHLQTETEAA